MLDLANYKHLRFKRKATVTIAPFTNLEVQVAGEILDALYEIETGHKRKKRHTRREVVEKAVHHYLKKYIWKWKLIVGERKADTPELKAKYRHLRETLTIDRFLNPSRYPGTEYHQHQVDPDQFAVETPEDLERRAACLSRET